MYDMKVKMKLSKRKKETNGKREGKQWKYGMGEIPQHTLHTYLTIFKMRLNQ